MIVSGYLQPVLDTAAAWAETADVYTSGGLAAEPAAALNARRKAALEAAWTAALTADEELDAADRITAEEWAAYEPLGSLEADYTAFLAERATANPPPDPEQLAALYGDYLLTRADAPPVHVPGKPDFDLRPQVIDLSDTGARPGEIETLRSHAAVHLTAAVGVVSGQELIDDWPAWRFSGGASTVRFYEWLIDYRARVPDQVVEATPVVSFPPPTVPPAAPVRAVAYRPGVLVSPPRPEDAVTGFETELVITEIYPAIPPRPGATRWSVKPPGADCPPPGPGETFLGSFHESSLSVQLCEYRGPSFPGREGFSRTILADSHDFDYDGSLAAWHLAKSDHAVNGGLLAGIVKFRWRNAVGLSASHDVNVDGNSHRLVRFARPEWWPRATTDVQTDSAREEQIGISCLAQFPDAQNVNPVAVRVREVADANPYSPADQPVTPAAPSVFFPISEAVRARRNDWLVEYRTGAQVWASFTIGPAPDPFPVVGVTILS